MLRFELQLRSLPRTFHRGRTLRLVTAEQLCKIRYFKKAPQDRQHLHTNRKKRRSMWSSFRQLHNTDTVVSRESADIDVVCFMRAALPTPPRHQTV